MRILTLFSILFLFTILMAIHLGDSSNWLWNNGTAANGYGSIGVVYFFALIIGGGALVLLLASMSEDQRGADDVAYNLIVGALTMLSVFCSSYLYAFTAAPLSSESGWLSGWLIYMLVGLLPVILHFNSLVSDRLERRREQPTEKDKVRNIR